MVEIHAANERKSFGIGGAGNISMSGRCSSQSMETNFQLESKAEIKKKIAKEQGEEEAACKSCPA